MTDTRALQRTLFRMQMDPVFARRVFARESAALASTALGGADVELLLGAELAAIEADRGGERRTQVAGNSASEFALSVAVASTRAALADVLEAFPASDELHAAIAHDGRLPLAFADFVLVRARAARDAEVIALCTLERALAVARRTPRGADEPGPGEVVLAPRSRLVDLPGGTFARAESVRLALDGDAPPPAAPFAPAEASETVLVVAAERPSPHALAEVRPERLDPPVDALLRRAERPLGAPARAAFARSVDASPDALEAFVDELVADGVLVRGPDGSIG